MSVFSELLLLAVWAIPALLVLYAIAFAVAFSVKKKDAARPYARLKLVVATVAIAALCFGIVLHALAGILDEGTIVLHPVGHLTIFVFIGWVMSIVAAVPTLTIRGWQRWFACCSILVSVAGIACL